MNRTPAADTSRTLVVAKQPLTPSQVMWHDAKQLIRDSKKFLPERRNLAIYLGDVAVTAIPLTKPWVWIGETGGPLSLGEFLMFITSLLVSFGLPVLWFALRNETKEALHAYQRSVRERVEASYE